MFLNYPSGIGKYSSWTIFNYNIVSLAIVLLAGWYQSAAADIYLPLRSLILDVGRTLCT